MKKILLIIFVGFLCSTSTFPQNADDDVVIGKYHVINSEILDEERRILVHLPLGYEETKLNYPVIFHLYGDFVATYFADAVSVINRLHDASKIPQVILVGVDNTDRYRDLRPVNRDGSPSGIENFIRYFQEELIPYINEKYRVEDYNILIGPQAGACFGLYALMEHTDLFDAFILENSFDNPSAVDEYLISKSKSFFNSKNSVNKFLYMNSREQSLNFQTALQEKQIIETNLPEGFRFEFKLSNTENGLIPSTDMKNGLTMLFEGYELPESVFELNDILEYYQDLSKKMGYQVNISDRVLTSAGNKYSQAGNREKAMEIFKHILEIYPKSLDALFQLAEINSSFGQYETAKQYYLEFLEIRPQEAIIKYRLMNVNRILNESATYEIEQIILSDGLARGMKAYTQLKADDKKSKYFDENELVRCGYRFLEARKPDVAIEIFRISTELFPESFNTWDCLGEAYMKQGDNALAIKNYEKSLELNPNNDNAKEMLKQLRRNK